MKIKRLHKDAVIPKYATKGAACFDVVATEIIEDAPGKVTVKFGFAADVGEGMVAEIQPRSSFGHKGWEMSNSPGQIDSDYRGEWMARFQAIPDDITVEQTTGLVSTHTVLKYPPFPYKVGDRAAQVRVEKAEQIQIIEVEELDETDRGAGGFGSTGV